MKEDDIRPIKRPPERARDSYNRIAPIYDLIAHPFEQKHKRLAVELLAPSPGEAILEPGCGTGNNLVDLGRRVGPSVRAVGFDIGEKMVEQARRKCDEAGVSGWTDVRAGNALSNEFDADSFDGVLLSFTLDLFDAEDIGTVLGECRRVLCPSGRIVVVSLSWRTVNLPVTLYEWFHDRFPEAIDCRPIHPSRHLSKAGFAVNTVRQLSLAGIPVEVVRARQSG